MSLPPISNSSTPRPDTAGKTADGQKTNPGPPAEPQKLSQRQQLNIAILQANERVQLSVQNEPLSLVFRSAIEAINAELEPSVGPNAIENAQQSGLDVSPEATANRIVSLTTALFSRYVDSNPDLSAEEQVNRFVDVIGGGILKGFEEAREILDGLGVLEGDIATNIDRTYDLVLEGLEAFRNQQLGTDSENA